MFLTGLEKWTSEEKKIIQFLLCVLDIQQYNQNMIIFLKTSDSFSV